MMTHIKVDIQRILSHITNNKPSESLPLAIEGDIGEKMVSPLIQVRAYDKTLLSTG